MLRPVTCAEELGAKGERMRDAIVDTAGRVRRLGATAGTVCREVTVLCDLC